MVASWSKVWKATASGSAASTSCCPTACCNNTSPTQLTANNTLADSIPVAVETIAEAVGYWVDHISRRLAARYTVTATSNQIYEVTFKRGQREDVVTWQVGPQGRYPVQISYTSDGKSGSASFYDVLHAVDWHVQVLA